MNSFPVRRLLSTFVIGLFGSAALGQASGVARPVAVTPATKPSAQAAAELGKLPLSFEPNRGQTESGVQWVSRGPDYTLFLTGHDAVLEMNRITQPEARMGLAKGAPRIESSALRMNLIGAQTPQQSQGEGVLKGRVNYLTGRDRSQWQRNVPLYSRVRLNEVYPGIDLAYYGSNGHLEYDFIVAPGADAAAIAFQIDGATPKLNAAGDLLLPVASGGHQVTFNKPVVYQMKDGKRQPVAANFTVAKDNRIAFALGNYDHSRELVIDPQLLFLGAYGTGNQQTVANGMTVDSAGEIMITGITNDLSLPVTSNALQSTCGNEVYNGQNLGGARCGPSSPGSAFVTKISADGKSLVYSTYLHGGEGNEYGGAIATDAAGNAYVLGNTGSNDFPITSDAIQTICGPYHPTSPGSISPNINAACTGFFNGGGTEYTVQPISLFLVKLDPTGSNILYGTFFGGSQQNDPVAIAVDSAGSIYFAANTHGVKAADSYYPYSGSIQYPTTASAFQTYAQDSGAGSYDGTALSKLSSDGHTLLYSTILATQSSASLGSVYSEGLAVGANGLAAIGGWTSSSSFVGTPGSFKPACTPNNSGNYCQTGYGWVADFDTTKAGSASLVWGSYVGGTTAPGSNIPQDQVQAVAMDSANNVYISGYTYDADFPTTAGAYQPTCLTRNGSCSATYLVKLAAANGAGVWSTLLASTNVVYGVGINGTGIVVDAKGRVNLYGSTSIGSYGIGGTFPVVNPIESVNNNGNSLFFSTFSPDGAQLLFSTQIHNTNQANIDGLTSILHGLAMDAAGNFYFAAYGSDGGTFSFTPGTYNTPATSGFNRTFFGKISPLLAPTGTMLSISPSSTSTGQVVTFTATVAGTSQSTPSPTGSVVLANNSVNPAAILGTIQLGSGGTGTFSTSSLAVGTYSVTGAYSGDSVYDISTSTAQTLTVNTALTPTIGLTVPASATVGASVTFSVTISGSGATPSGTVYFKDGSTMLGSSVLSGGTATYSTSGLGVGQHSITASYGGDTVYASGTSSAQTITINTATTSITLTVPATAAFGASVTLSASVSGSGGTPSGTVTFYDGSTLLSAVNLANGSASYTSSSFASGAHSITAAYSGDTHFGAVTSSAQTLTIGLPVPIVGLTVPATAVVGTSVTFAATVSGTGTTPTGTVTFLDGQSTLGTGALTGGSASYSTSALSVGTHNISVMYGGDTHFGTASAGPKAVAISQATPTIVALVPALGITNVPITLSATVSGTPGTPTGSLTFTDGSTTLATVALSGGTASYTTSTLSAGTHSIVVTYSGDTVFTGVASAAQTLKVSVPANVTLTLSPPGITIPRGTTATAQITATPTVGYAGTLNFTCGALPSFASCVFAPPSLTFTSASSAAQTTTLTISTTSAALAAAPIHPVSRTGAIPGILAALLLAPLGLWARTRGARRHLKGREGLLAAGFMLFVSLAGMASMMGCGSSGANETPAGSYTVPINVSGGTTQSINLQVTVQ